MLKFSYRGPTYNFGFFGRNSCDREFPRYVKDIICYNQGEFLQYFLLAAEFHKCMKAAYFKGDVDIAKERHNTLLGFLNRNLERITKKNFEFLHSHFKTRSNQAPRICIKAGYNIDNKDSVVSLFRDGNVNYQSNCRIEQNSGFKWIYDTGRPYICNDIPNEVRVNGYLNPRLNVQAAKLYNRPGFIKQKLGLAKGEDKEWRKCWNSDDNQSVTNDSCYKSTLIVPMTLWNNSLGDTFRKLINLDEVERTIFGFLCIDHINIDYFIPDIDIPIGYVFSDLLSLVFDVTSGIYGKIRNVPSC
ncbi:hypothetical protein [Candidatus Thiosymbion oneisti]|uniref:hypothetical protein n=1 Tax=Candidatus Thiosymbion oneisti TaxID=589554 RepID=UPI00105D4085|nr:hypothetical protein [Candidatus Thiosymbion oneisti]